MNTPDLELCRGGDKIKFKCEKQRYTIQARDDRYIICTKPFNAKKTVLYTIIDLERNVRGTENLIFCMGFGTKQLCLEALERLQKGDSEVSYRNFIPLDIESIHLKKEGLLITKNYEENKNV